MSRIKTHEQFIKEVYDLVGDEYKILSTYINSRTKIRVRHNTCGYEWETYPNNILAGSKCPKCKYHMLTHEEFIKEVYDLVGNEYTVLEKYINSHSKILMRHNTCGYEWKVQAHRFLKRNARCPECVRKKQAKTHEQFIKEVYDLVGDEYTVLGKYINNSTKILMRHNTCGHKWEIRPGNFLVGKRCPICRLKEKTKTHEKFIKEVYDLVGDEYTIMGTYTNSKNKILIRHNTCGNEFEMNANGFLTGSRCPKCSCHIKTHEEFIKEIQDLFGDKITILGNYVNQKTKILVRCNNCGNEFYVFPTNLQRGHGCAKCCNVSNHLVNTELFKQRVYDLTGDEYTVLGEYKSSNTKILMRHNTCGNEFETLPSRFLKGSRCPNSNCRSRFNRGTRLDTAEFKQRVYDLTGDEYTVLGEYKSSNTKILMRHNTCGYEWEVTPTAFTCYYNSFMLGETERVGTRCPKCCHKGAKNKYLDIVKKKKLIDKNETRRI